MVSPGGPSLGRRVKREHVYGTASRFAPSGNALAFNRLMFGPPLDAWHFVFAPNPASSAAARVAIRSQRSRGWKGKVVQTVASHPQSFSRGLFFGDRVVALSEWTRSRLLRAGLSDTAVRLIPPCASEPTPRASREEMRERLGIGTGLLVVYPGDLHVSTGAATLAHAIPDVLREVPGVRFVFACRSKGQDTASHEADLRTALQGLDGYVQQLGRVDDMHGLLRAADIVAFPVDNLRGKVDLPIVLLEAMALARPLVLASGGPLDELPGVRVPPRDAAGLARALIDLARDEAARKREGDVGRETWQRKHTPEVVAAQHDALYAELM